MTADQREQALAALDQMHAAIDPDLMEDGMDGSEARAALVRAALTPPPEEANE